MTVFTYPRAMVRRVIDGDTVEVMIDQGFGSSQVVTLRLLGINAPEVNGPTRDAGRAAKVALTGRLMGRLIRLETHKNTQDGDKQEKYGRYLADIWDSEGHVNAWLVEQGHAVKADY